MKLAITYENGDVFQHCGKTEQFKVYDIEDNEIKSAEVVNVPEGVGHGALAGFLQELGVTVLICGGLGLGAQNFLNDAGIMVCGGAEGNADDAAQDYVRGELSYDPQAAEHHGPCGHCHDHQA